MSNGPFLYPNVTSLPGQAGVSPYDSSLKKRDEIPGEFDRIFDQTLDKSDRRPNLEHIKVPLKFSAHAVQRMQDRKIAFDPLTLSRINEAVDKAEAKGIEDSLILTRDAALIVSVKNRTVITALDRDSLSGNVFSNIDGAVIV